MFGSKYKLGKRIGAGGMAEVFRAERVGTQGFARAVAIKRVRPQWSAHPRYAEMFIHEARLMAGLRHPNVVAVFDFARDGEEDLFLVMELVEGVALLRLVQRGPVPVPVAIYIVTELLRGLGHLHDRVDADGKPLGLVHRDLSPGNVLLSWDGAVKLGDFGIAKASAGTGAGLSAWYGTPGYTSPEQLRGSMLDRRSDLFVVGVLLYELLTGTKLFVGEDRIQLEIAVLRQRIDPPRALRPEVPADLDALTMQLLAREREGRPESAEAVIDALDRCEAASHLGRKELIALLHERCPASGAKGGHDSEALRKTEPKRARAQAPAPIEPAPAAANASQSRAAGDPEPPPPQALIEQLFQHLPPAACGAAPAEQAPAAAQAQPPSPSTSSAHHSAPITNARRRWVWAAGLLLVLGSATGWFLLRDGREASQRLSHIGGQSTEECRSEESLQVHRAHDAPADAPAPSQHEPASAAQKRRADEPGTEHVTAPALVEMF